MRPNNSASDPAANPRLVSIVMWTCLLLTMAAAPAVGQSQSDTVHIDPGGHAAVEIDFRDGPTKDVSYDVTVQEGPNVDVLFLDNANYQKYSDGESFEYVERWSDLDTGNTVNDFRLERHGTWWLVIDHTGEPDGGTSPATVGAESVTARYTLETETNVTDEARDRFDELPAPGVSTGVGLLGVVALFAARRET